MRAWSAVAIFAVCVGSSISADAAAPSRVGKPDVSSRVLRLHRAVLQLLPLIVKGGAKHDSATTANVNVNCPTGGTMKVTSSATSTTTGATSSSANTDYTLILTDCKTGDDTMSGDMKLSYTASASNGGATNTITVTYAKTNVVLKSISPEAIVTQGLTISTVATTSGSSASGAGTSQVTTTASGNVTVNGNVFAYTKETIDGPPKP